MNIFIDRRNVHRVPKLTTSSEHEKLQNWYYYTNSCETIANSADIKLLTQD